MRRNSTVDNRDQIVPDLFAYGSIWLATARQATHFQKMWERRKFCTSLFLQKFFFYLLEAAVASIGYRVVFLLRRLHLSFAHF